MSAAAEVTARAAERAARGAYGRLVAMLAARCHDIAAAEDALADAFVAALESWPAGGVPDNPDAWLLTAARRRLVDGSRRSAVRADAAEELLRQLDERAAATDDEAASAAPFLDERLKLLFVCAHPAIDASVRAPLMLQTVLGLDAARIAGALLVAPKTLGQRLWRAKEKIRDSGVAFEVPAPAELPERLGAVLEAIYAAYGSGWEDVTGDDPRRKGLSDEAIWLARLTAQLLPTEPEPRGLLALLLYAEARRGARRDADGRYVPLSKQDPGGWDAGLLAEAEATLMAASRQGGIGPYQLEAAIQSAHVEERRTGRSNGDVIALLYGGLEQMSPTVGVKVARAAAEGRARGAAAGVALLDGLPREEVATYQPFWALRGHLLRELGDPGGARAAWERALGLTEDPALRRFFYEELRRLDAPA